MDNAAGALLPTNLATLLPAFGERGTGLMNLAYTQFLSRHVAVVAGKLSALGADYNAFAHDFRSQFMNTALNFNITAALFPLSAYGGGIVILPWEGAQFSISALDPNGTPSNNDISDAFQDGVLVGGEARVTIKPFGLVGHQLVGFGWSNKDHTSLKQDPSNLATALLQQQFPRLANPGPILRRFLERFFPELLVTVVPLNKTSSTWTIYYNFDQYLWNPDGQADRGLGLFFRFGASDGVANPIKYAYNVGVSAKGIVPGRPDDSFGLGWARTQLSNNFVPFLRQRLDLGLNHEDAVELYYNASVTRWLGATLPASCFTASTTRPMWWSTCAAKAAKTSIIRA